jgi:hypothetical protein
MYSVNEGYDAVPLTCLVKKLATGEIVASGMRYNGSQVQVHFQAAAAEEYDVTALVILAVTNKCDD